jgi:uridine kinase
MKKLIIVDGFLIFTVKELSNLFDYKIFIDVSDVNILYRRLIRDGGMGQINAIYDVVIPVSKEYKQMQKDNADLVIDGDRPKEEVINDTGRYLCEKLSQGNADFKVGLPPKQFPW